MDAPATQNHHYLNRAPRAGNYAESLRLTRRTISNTVALMATIESGSGTGGVVPGECVQFRITVREVPDVAHVDDP